MEHNAKPQHGALNGMSPDAAFLAFQDKQNPVPWLPEKLHWLLSYRYRVTVTHSGVRFTHFGEKIRVRGGNLASIERIGREFWAVLDRRAADCVTFMSMDFSDVFTEPLRPVVHYDESESAPDSGALKIEYETKAAHRRVVEDHYQGLIDRHGDPRTELLRQAQEEARQNLELDAAIGFNGRIPLVDPNVRAANEEGERQRAEVRGSKPKSKARGNSGSDSSRPGFDEARRAIFAKKEKIQ